MGSIGNARTTTQNTILLQFKSCIVADITLKCLSSRAIILQIMIQPGNQIVQHRCLLRCCGDCSLRRAGTLSESTIEIGRGKLAMISTDDSQIRFATTGQSIVHRQLMVGRGSHTIIDSRKNQCRLLNTGRRTNSRRIGLSWCHCSQRSDVGIGLHRQECRITALDASIAL